MVNLLSVAVYRMSLWDFKLNVWLPRVPYGYCVWYTLKWDSEVYPAAGKGSWVMECQMWAWLVSPAPGRKKKNGTPHLFYLSFLNLFSVVLGTLLPILLPLLWREREIPSSQTLWYVSFLFYTDKLWIKSLSIPRYWNFRRPDIGTYKGGLWMNLLYLLLRGKC